MPSLLNRSNASKWPRPGPSIWWVSNNGDFIFAGRKGSQEGVFSTCFQIPPTCPTGPGVGCSGGKEILSPRKVQCMSLQEDNPAEQFLLTLSAPFLPLAFQINSEFDQSEGDLFLRPGGLGTRAGGSSFLTEVCVGAEMM